MTSKNDLSRPLRISCPNFCAEEISALRSLYDLVKKHLKDSWEVVAGQDADLVLVNLDKEWRPEQPLSAPVVGCAQRPRQHPSGTIHRPLRVAELLAVLSDLGETAGRGRGAAATDFAVDSHYRLLAWPLEFEQWPGERWRILASILRVARSTREIAQRTDLAPDDVAGFIAMLERMDLVERVAGSADVPPPSVGRWQGLAAKVGRLLGFAR